jgi:acyl-CoA thioesterase I
MTHFFPRLFISFGLLILCTGLSVPSAVVNAAGAPVILVSGDSLSAAYRINASAGWVALLQKRLQAENLPHSVVNASISGATSSGGLNRLQDALKKFQPTIVLIELGANDGLRGLPLKLMRKNLSEMISIAQQNNARVLLLGMRLPPNYGPAYTQEYAQVFVELAQKYQTGLVPFLLQDVAGQPRLMQSDGLHPTAAAQAQLLETVWPYLLPLLSQ